MAGVESMIHLIRGQKVMLDADLARLYRVETKALKRAVKRNAERFPADFMFQLEPQELTALRCQIGTSKGRGGTRYLSYVFTQEGIAMLSGVLNSSRAIQVNVAIMRAFVRMREFLLSQNDVAKQLAELEKKYESHDEAIQEIFFAIKKLMSPSKSRRRPGREIGFHTLLAEHSKPK